ESPPARPRIALIFGADPGPVSASAEALTKAWAPGADPLNIAKLGEDDLKRDPQLLADVRIARTLHARERVVSVRSEKDAGARLILSILADIETDALRPEAYWIVEAGELNKSNKLRAAFEGSKAAIALQLFADDEASLSELVAKRLAAAG